MSDNGFQKLETKILIQSSKEDLVARFPVSYNEEVVEVFMDGNLIYEERDPYSGLYKLLDAMKKRSPTRIGYVKSKGQYTFNGCIQLGERRYDVLFAGTGECNVMVRSYQKDLEEHYQSVDIVRAYLSQAGYVVGSGKCEVTRKIRC